MPLSKKQKELVENTIRTSLRNRLEKYNPEPAVMPFHTRLLGKDRLTLYSFIHSLNVSTQFSMVKSFFSFFFFFLFFFFFVKIKKKI